MLSKLAMVMATLLLLSATAAWASRNPDLDDPTGTAVVTRSLTAVVVAPAAVPQSAPVSIEPHESHRSLDLDRI